MGSTMVGVLTPFLLDRAPPEIVYGVIVVIIIHGVDFVDVCAVIRQK